MRVMFCLCFAGQSCAITAEEGVGGGFLLEIARQLKENLPRLEAACRAAAATRYPPPNTFPPTHQPEDWRPHAWLPLRSPSPAVYGLGFGV